MITEKHRLGFSDDLLLAAINHDWILCGVEASKARCPAELLKMIDGVLIRKLQEARDYFLESNAGLEPARKEG